MKKMEKDDQDVFYVNLNDPVELHRSILESTKHVLSNLKRYEAFKKVRTYKVEYLMQLKHVMGEINLLVNRLNREMPKTGLRALADKAAPPLPKKVKKAEVPKPIPVVEEQKSKIDMLEEELDDIEAKLKGLE